MSLFFFFFFLMIRRPPRSTQSRSSAASDVYKRQPLRRGARRKFLRNLFPPSPDGGVSLRRSSRARDCRRALLPAAAPDRHQVDPLDPRDYPVHGPDPVSYTHLTLPTIYS